MERPKLLPEINSAIGSRRDFGKFLTAAAGAVVFSRISSPEAAAQSAEVSSAPLSHEGQPIQTRYYVVFGGALGTVAKAETRRAKRSIVLSAGLGAVVGGAIGEVLNRIK